MKYYMSPIIESDEIEKAFELQYDIKVDIVKLFFDYGYNELEYLNISKEEDEYDKEEYTKLDEEFDHARLRILIRSYLRNVMPPDTDCVVVHFDF